MVEVLILSEGKKKNHCPKHLYFKLCMCMPIVFKSVWIFFPSIEGTHSTHVVYISQF